MAKNQSHKRRPVTNPSKYSTFIPVKNWKDVSVYKGAPSDQEPRLDREWYVFYYFNKNFNRQDQPPIWERQRTNAGINTGRTIKKREELASIAMEAVTELLKGGFNPYLPNQKKPEAKRKEGSPMTLKQGIEWAKDTKWPHWKKKSREANSSVLNKFYAATDKMGITNEPLGNIRKVHMRECFLLMLKREKKEDLGGHAYHKYKDFIFGMFKVLEDFEFIAANPASFRAEMKKPPAKKRKTHRPHEIQEITDHFTEENPDFLKYLRLLFYTTMRPFEAFNVRIGGIDIRYHEITLYARDTKDAEDRTIIIHKNLDAMLTEMLATPGIKSNWFLFGEGYKPEPPTNPDPDRAEKLAEKAGKYYKAEVKDGLGIDVDMYALKKLASTTMANKGVQAEARQKQMGHASYQETQDAYTELDRPDIREQLRNWESDF